MSRPKREAPITLHAPIPLKKAIKKAAEHHDRSVSHFLIRLVEKDPSVQIFLQQIGGAVESH